MSPQRKSLVPVCLSFILVLSFGDSQAQQPQSLPPPTVQEASPTVSVLASSVAHPLIHAPMFSDSAGWPVDESSASDTPVYPENIDVLSRLEDLEHRADESESQWKAIQEKNKKAEAEKKKFPSAILNGAFQADAVAFQQDDSSRDVYGSIESGANLRRARLGASGAVSDRTSYFFQMDFGIYGRPTFTDVWAEFKEVGPLGNVRVGQWKQPFSLEVVSSYRYTTFMERASTFQAFTPFRHIGVGFQDHAEDLSSTWAVSYLRTGQDQFGGSLSTDQGNGMAGRLTHLPWYSDCGDDYLHLGLGYFLDAPPNGLMRIRTIPEIFVGEFAADSEPRGTSGIAVPSRLDGTPTFVDTGTLTDISLANTYGTEAFWVRGPFRGNRRSWLGTSTAQRFPTPCSGVDIRRSATF